VSELENEKNSVKQDKCVINCAVCSQSVCLSNCVTNLKFCLICGRNFLRGNNCPPLARSFQMFDV
jgi:hypothetical protein